MSFLEHLDELRSRLLRCAIAYIASLAACWAFREPIATLVASRRHVDATSLSDPKVDLAELAQKVAPGQVSGD